MLCVRIIDTLMVAAVGYALGLSALFYALLVLLYGICLYGFLQFRMHTSVKTARRMESYAGMYIVAFDLLLGFGLGRHFGVITRFF